MGAIKLRKRLALLLVGSMSVAQLPIYGLAVTEHWASESMIEWHEKGIIKGYGANDFRPDQQVTRAELAVFITRVFGLLEKDEAKNYTDVEQDVWYTEAIQAVSSADIMNDYDTHFRPHDYATREEVAYALANAYEVAGKVDKTFADEALISEWARESVEALVANEVMIGKANNMLEPQANVTRAEVVTMLDRLTAQLYNQAGTYTEDIRGNVVVNTADVVLKDMVIEGNLYVGQGVGEGDFTLDGVTVSGQVIVEGGGAHSVNLVGNTKVHTVRSNKEGVRLVVGDSAQCGKLYLSESAVLDGKFETVAILSEAVVTLQEGSTIDTLEAHAPIQLEGKGKVETLVVGKDVEVKDVKVSAQVNKVTDANGTDIKEQISNKPSGGSSSGSDNGSDDDNGTDDDNDSDDDNGSDDDNDNDADQPALHERFELNGAVVLPDGSPAENASISLTRFIEDRKQYAYAQRVEADEMGNYHFENLLPGKYRVSVSCETGDKTYVSQEKDLLTIKKDGVEGNIKLVEATSLQLQFQSSQTVPVEAVRVEACLYNSQGDRIDYYMWGNGHRSEDPHIMRVAHQYKEGDYVDYKVYLNDEMIQSGKHTLVSANDQVEIALPEIECMDTADLTVRVTRDGEVVPHAKIEVRREKNGISEWIIEDAVTDDQGIYKLESLDTDYLYHVYIDKKGETCDYTGGLYNLKLTENMEIEETLHDYDSLRLEVHDSSGRVLGGKYETVQFEMDYTDIGSGFKETQHIFYRGDEQDPHSRYDQIHPDYPTTLRLKETSWDKSYMPASWDIQIEEGVNNLSLELENVLTVDQYEVVAREREQLEFILELAQESEQVFGDEPRISTSNVTKLNAYSQKVERIDDKHVKVIMELSRIEEGASFYLRYHDGRIGFSTPRIDVMPYRVPIEDRQVYGKVVLPDGEPVAYAEVQLSGKAEDGTYKQYYTSTDEKGEYAFDQLDNLIRVTIVASKDSRDEARYRSETLSVGNYTVDTQRELEDLVLIESTDILMELDIAEEWLPDEAELYYTLYNDDALIEEGRIYSETQRIYNIRGAQVGETLRLVIEDKANYYEDTEVTVIHKEGFNKVLVPLSKALNGPKANVSLEQVTPYQIVGTGIEARIELENTALTEMNSKELAQLIMQAGFNINGRVSVGIEDERTLFVGINASSMDNLPSAWEFTIPKEALTTENDLKISIPVVEDTAEQIPQLALGAIPDELFMDFTKQGDNVLVVLNKLIGKDEVEGIQASIDVEVNNPWIDADGIITYPENQQESTLMQVSVSYGDYTQSKEVRIVLEPVNQIPNYNVLTTTPGSIQVKSGDKQTFTVTTGSALFVTQDMIDQSEQAIAYRANNVVKVSVGDVKVSEDGKGLTFVVEFLEVLAGAKIDFAIPKEWILTGEEYFTEFITITKIEELME